MRSKFKIKKKNYYNRSRFSIFYNYLKGEQILLN